MVIKERSLTVALFLFLGDIMIFCETKQNPPPWFYVGLLLIALAVTAIAPYTKEIINFWVGL